MGRLNYADKSLQAASLRISRRVKCSGCLVGSGGGNDLENVWLELLFVLLVGLYFGHSRKETVLNLITYCMDNYLKTLGEEKEVALSNGRTKLGTFPV